MSDKIYPISNDYAVNSRFDQKAYLETYRDSVENNEDFWSRQAQRLDWHTPFTKVKNTHWSDSSVSIKWFEDGELNVCYNCVDRHLKAHADKTAILWESDDGQKTQSISFLKLYDEVCQMANALKSIGVKKGDRVTLYMPMIPEAAYAMLACARLGAVHSVVFAGFSAEALAGRIDDCESHFVITADEGFRAGKTIPLKQTVDQAIEMSQTAVKKSLVMKYTSTDVGWNDSRDVDYLSLIHI